MDVVRRNGVTVSFAFDGLSRALIGERISVTLFFCTPKQLTMKQPTTTSKLIRIAIAEDFKMIREMIVANVNALEYCQMVFEAANGQELLDYIEKTEIKLDICILDINMPGVNGYDAQKHIHKHWPGIKTLAMSVFDEPECIAQMLINGANGFISKNSSVQLFQEAILSVYEHGIYPFKEAGQEPLPQSKGLPTLTEREKEYLTLTCAELNVEEIADKMFVSTRTVEHYRDNVYQKTGVTNKADLLFYVMKTGIVFMK